MNLFPAGSMMSNRVLIAATVLLLALRPTLADETLYRYEGDVLPYDETAGWIIANPCDPPCGESLEDGRFVLRWPQTGDRANYALTIATPPQEPPPTLWVEWRFRSNHPIGPNFFTCDARFQVKYGGMIESVNMYGDTAISFEGGQFTTGLDLEQFHTYRYESVNGIDYRISVDGLVFIVDARDSPNGLHSLQFSGRGGCVGDEIPNMANEWDFVRYGTISSGEKIVSADPPAGVLNSALFADLDRFTVTFDAANYVHLDEITVEVSGGVAPTVTQTRRRENDGPETVEIVLDRPMPLDETTRFIFDDGQVTNTIEYTLVKPPIIPTLSHWGLVAMAALTIACGTLILRRRRNPAR